MHFSADTSANTFANTFTDSSRVARQESQHLYASPCRVPRATAENMFVKVFVKLFVKVVVTMIVKIPVIKGVPE